jgi:hypothetical protein
MKVAEILETESVDNGQTGLRALYLGHGDGTVELHHR